MKFSLLDLRDPTWMEAHGRDTLILTAMALVALSLIVGIFMWVKKRQRNKKL